MESQALSFLQAFAFLILFCLLIITITKKAEAQTKPSKNPPGPWKLPIIGNLHQLVGPFPHRTLRDLAIQHGPLMHLQLGEVSTIVVSSPKLAKLILKTHDLNFADRPRILSARIMGYNCTNIAFSPYGHYWRQLRKICTIELFSAKQVESFRHLREEETSKFIKTISSNLSNCTVNLTEKLSSLSMNIIARAAFGKECKEKERVVSAIREPLKLSSGLNMADLFPSCGLVEVISGLRLKIEKAFRDLDEVFDRIIEDFKKERESMENFEGGLKDSNFLDVLLTLQQGSKDSEFPITNNNIKAMILDMFIGGTESTSSVIEWIMAELIKNPRVMEKAQAEVRQVFGADPSKPNEKDTSQLHYLRAIVKETLRLHTPGPLLVPRECREKCEIEGYVIPQKSRIIVNAWAMARDPQYWDDAESFKPERFEGNNVDFLGSHLEFIPFGAGRRICPGITFATANLLLVVAQLLYYFDWKLPSDLKPEHLDMTEEFGLAMRRKSDLCLVPISRI